MPITRYYLLLILIFSLFWPVLTLPMFSSLSFYDVLMPLALPMPFAFAFGTGAHLGRRPWPAVAVVSFAAASLTVALHVDIVTHDTTLLGALPFIFRLTTVPSLAAVGYCFAGTLVKNRGVGLTSILGISGIGFAIAALWSIFAWYDGEPFNEIFNLQVLAMGIGFTGFLALAGTVVLSWSGRRVGVQESTS